MRGTFIGVSRAFPSMLMYEFLARDMVVFKVTLKVVGGLYATNGWVGCYLQN